MVLDFTGEDACATLACVRSMESPAQNDYGLTPSQRRAVAARGNVLVMAGAGTGKTRTLVERCLDCLDHEHASLDELLIVTFTEAAAAEMRQRLRERIEEKIRDGSDEPHWAAQLALFDAAHIGTLHSFCLKLVREHFYELGLDPQPAVLDEGEARLLANETLAEEMQIHYTAENELAEAVQKLIQIYGGGRDEKIRSLVLRLHHYTQTRPDADGWHTRQLEKFTSPEPDEWRAWLVAAICGWRGEWLPALENLRAGNSKAAECFEILEKLPERFSRDQAAAVLSRIQAADAEWPRGKKTILRKPLEDFFPDAAFLAALAPVENSHDPLLEDWHWVRGHMTALLRLTQNFSARFAARKRDDGVLDFHDLEQFALKLLWDFVRDKPSPVAERWREKIRFVFVDEYQDINAAQDKIIQALSRVLLGVPPLGGPGSLPPKGGTPNIGNRFLVGDVKQSIYRFRLADPKIFREYAAAWRGQNGQTIPLAENFRSREGLLHFVNSIFEFLMHERIGGVRYDAEAQLQFGSPETRTALGLAKDPTPRAELLLHFKKSGRAEANFEDETGADNLTGLEETEKAARLLAQRLKELKNARHEIWDVKQKAFRLVEWRDMAVLLRSPANKAEPYAKEFERVGVPLVVERGGFFESAEILDLLSLLQLLDNPLQDVPCLAVLRSPLVGLSLDELGEIRFAAKDVHFWTALNRARNAEYGMRSETVEKIGKLLKRFRCWRQGVRQSSLSGCLEDVLAETHFAEWLRSRPRGAQRQANVERFLNLARRFDQFQRQGLFRFLKFIEAQREAGVEPEVAGSADENAVRLMSIHQSKGLEFPVVAVADLAKPFNTQDLRAEIILDEQFGLCPRVKPPHTGRRYPSLPHWLAQRREHRELWGEELRLLYVAVTRARDTLILSGTVTERKWQTLWIKPDAVTPPEILAAKCCADWLGLWFAQQAKGAKANGTEGKLPHLRWRIVGDEELAEKWSGQPFPLCGDPCEPEALDKKTKQKFRTALTWEYGFSAATKQAAKSSVTALRRRAADESDNEAEQTFAPRQFTHAAKRVHGKLSATETGSAHHKFLQYLALENANDVAALKSEVARLKREKVLSADECAALDLEAVAAFWQSDPGRRIRANAVNVRRELAFTAKFSPQELVEIVGTKPEAGLENEFIVVQGVADLVVLLPEEIWLVDFKTDEVRGGELPSKIKIYAPQLKLYARALAKIYSRPVSACWLHFSSQNRSVFIG
ncbi:MAG: UvrD-helicase domain-containing protein [Verrucomicrobiota bacterium]